MISFDQWQQTEDFDRWQKVQCSLLNCTKTEHNEFLQKIRESGQPPGSYINIAKLAIVCNIHISEIKDINSLTDNIPIIDLS